MATHLKDRDPELWAHVVSVCQQVANEGRNPSEAARRLRDRGVQYHSIFHWLRNGDLTCFEHDGHKWRPVPKYL